MFLTGSPVEVELAVPHRLDTFSFEFVKMESENGRLFIKLRPRFFIIRLFVPDIIFEFSSHDKNLIAARGMTLLYEETENGFKPFIGTLFIDN